MFYQPYPPTPFFFLYSRLDPTITPSSYAHTRTHIFIVQTLQTAFNFEIGDFVEVVADTTPGMNILGIASATVVAFDSAKGTAKVLPCSGMEHKSEITVPAHLLRAASKTSLHEVASRGIIRAETKKRASLEAAVSDAVVEKKQVIAEKDVSIDVLHSQAEVREKTINDLRVQATLSTLEKKDLKDKAASEKREYQKKLRAESEEAMSKMQRKTDKKIERLEKEAASETADFEKHYLNSLKTLANRSMLQELEYKQTLETMVSRMKEEHGKELLAARLEERGATEMLKQPENLAKQMELANAALSRGDPDDPSLTKAGRALALKLEEQIQLKIVQAQRRADYSQEQCVRLKQEVDCLKVRAVLKDEVLEATRAELKALKQKVKRRDEQIAGLKDGTTFKKQSPEKLPGWMQEWQTDAAVSVQKVKYIHIYIGV